MHERITSIGTSLIFIPWFLQTLQQETSQGRGAPRTQPAGLWRSSIDQGMGWTKTAHKLDR